MSDYLAVCEECKFWLTNGYCPVQGAVKKPESTLCEHFDAKQ